MFGSIHAFVTVTIKAPTRYMILFIDVATARWFGGILSEMIVKAIGWIIAKKP